MNKLRDGGQSYMSGPGANTMSGSAGGILPDSPGKSFKAVPNAGILNSKTLAEENLKGFRLRNL